MEEKLLSRMASDLNIRKYHNETTLDYECRLLYSAIASWIKAACMDRSILSLASSQSGRPGDGVSRRHILIKCVPVFDELMKRFPHLQPWFDTHKMVGNAVEYLRSGLIACGEMVNVGYDTSLALAKEERIQLTPVLARCKGIVLSPDCFYSGVSTLCVTDPIDSTHLADVTSVEQWFSNYIENAWWTSVDNLGESVSFFDPYHPSRSNTYSWQDTPTKGVQGVLLLRRIVNKYDREYVLYKPSEKKIHRIDSVYKDFREYRRIMMGMRVSVNNPVPMTVYTYDDHVKIVLSTHLPRKEFLMLRTYAWPRIGIIGKLEWDMPVEVWLYLKPWFAALGMDIAEEQYG